MADPTPESPADIAGEDIASRPVVEGDSVAAQANKAESDIVADLIGGTIGAGPEVGLLEGPLRGPVASGDVDLSHLPLHTRSLLKIPVTVRVTLAGQRRAISEITELGPGTLVKFEKTYDEPLQLSIGELPIAEGEAVKVGDKFGLRISKIIRPHERFKSVG
jgi:flagellar motor switch/type III secretory pathway protein FliN